MPGPTTSELVARVCGTMARRLMASGLEEQAHAADELARLRVADPPRAQDEAPSVLRHLDRAGEIARREGGLGALAPAALALAEHATWTQTASYRTAALPPGFLSGYAHATLAGPIDGTASPVTVNEAALGLLLLGPDLHYPPHRHPADEVYLPLGPASWLDTDGRYRHRAAGHLLHHPPGQPHGTKTGATPLLAVYLWTGDVRTPAELC